MQDKSFLEAALFFLNKNIQLHFNDSLKQQNINCMSKPHIIDTCIDQCTNDKYILNN